MAKNFGINWTSDVVTMTIVHHGLLAGNIVFTALAQTKVDDFYVYLFGILAAGCVAGLIVTYFMALLHDHKKATTTPTPCQVTPVADQEAIKENTNRMAKNFFGINWTSDVVTMTIVYHGLLAGNIVFTALAQTKVDDFYVYLFGILAAGCVAGLIVTYFMALLHDHKKATTTPTPCQVTPVADQEAI